MKKIFLSSLVAISIMTVMNGCNSNKNESTDNNSSKKITINNDVKATKPSNLSQESIKNLKFKQNNKWESCSVDINTAKKNIQKVLNSQSKNEKTKFQIDTIKELKTAKGVFVFNVKVLENKEEKSMIPMVAFNKGNYVIPFTRGFTILNKNGVVQDKSIMETIQEFQKWQMDKQKMKREKQINNVKPLLNPQTDNAIFLDSGKEKTLVVFTDPNCPFCSQELSSVEEQLKKTNVYYILNPLVNLDENNNAAPNSLHVNSLTTSANIMEEIKTAKTNEEKIKIMKKHFDPSGKKEKENFSPETKEKIVKNIKKYQKKDYVTGTPFRFEVETKELFKNKK